MTETDDHLRSGVRSNKNVAWVRKEGLMNKWYSRAVESSTYIGREVGRLENTAEVPDADPPWPFRSTCETATIR